MRQAGAQRAQKPRSSWRPRRPGAPPRRQRQIEADEAVDGPDDSDHAEHAHAPAVAAPELRDVHRVVQLVEEGDEVLPRHRPYRAPITPAQLDAGVGIEEDLVVVERVTLAGRRIDPRHHEEPQRVALLRRHEKVDDTRAGIALLDHPGELDRGDRGALGRDVEQPAVQDIVKLVIPGDDRAGDAGEEQEAGREQSRPAMQPAEDRSHGCLPRSFHLGGNSPAVGQLADGLAPLGVEAAGRRAIAGGDVAQVGQIGDVQR